MRQVQKLNITFHNPNTDEGLQKALVKIAAEVAKAQVEAKILHSNQSGENKPQQ